MVEQASAPGGEQEGEHGRGRAPRACACVPGWDGHQKDWGTAAAPACVLLEGQDRRAGSALWRLFLLLTRGSACRVRPRDMLLVKPKPYLYRMAGRQT